MGFFVYGKRTEPDGKFILKPDKQFRPLDVLGRRVVKLEDAIEFATREDAQEWVNEHAFKDGVKIEIRKKND